MSLVETGRVAGKVRNEQIASLGSILQPASIADQVEFWHRLSERLKKLSNPLAPEDLEKIVGSIDERVAMLTPEELRSLKLENAKAESEYWDALSSSSEACAALSRKRAIEAESAADVMAANLRRAANEAPGAETKAKLLQLAHNLELVLKWREYQAAKATGDPECTKRPPEPPDDTFCNEPFLVNPSCNPFAGSRFCS